MTEFMEFIECIALVINNICGVYVVSVLARVLIRERTWRRLDREYEMQLIRERSMANGKNG